MAKRISPPTKTLRFRLNHGSPHAGEWLAETQRLYNRAVEFFFGVFQQRPELCEMGGKEMLTAFEKLTHKTKRNKKPGITPPAEIELLPAMFRRASLHAAHGMAQSFFSNLSQWKTQKVKAEEKAKKKNKKLDFHIHPPVPPRVWNQSVVLYAGQYKNWDGKTVMLRLWTGKSWAWCKFQISGPDTPDGWELGSPCVVFHIGKWRLHVPIKKQEPVYPKKAEVQRQDSQTIICVVDLNISRNQACCIIQSADGKVLATLYVQGAEALHSRRKRVLGKVAVRRSQTGVIEEGVQDNKHLWRHIRAMNEYEAHRVSRRIVDFAKLHHASVIVFEYLANFRPAKGKYSTRGNEKRSYWLRGKIFRFSKYKAWNEGILSVRVNPAHTSDTCYLDETKLVRYTPGQPMEGYTEGAPLIWCPTCNHRENADRHATRNIGHRFFFPPKPFPKGKGVPLSGHVDKQEPVRPASEGECVRVGTTHGVRRPLRQPTGRGYASITQDAAHARAPKEAAGL
jgi:putative transposase